MNNSFTESGKFFSNDNIFTGAAHASSKPTRCPVNENAIVVNLLCDSRVDSASVDGHATTLRGHRIQPLAPERRLNGRVSDFCAVLLERQATLPAWICWGSKLNLPKTNEEIIHTH